jgi:hypothetical protein
MEHHIMARDSFSPQNTVQQATTTARRRRPSIISGLVVRIFIALILSWLIVMFFVTVVVSH